MSRNRVRRPFAVEVKQRGRSAAAPAEQRPPSGLWNLTDLAQELVRPAVPPKAPAPVTHVPVLQAKSEVRRVLPSLIAPPPEPDEPPPVSEAEPRLPRVRRVVTRKAVKMPPTPRPDVQARIELPRPSAVAAAPRVTEEQPAAPRPARARLPRSPETLRVGERWKRRLPRVCW